ncbi:hypothetical protein EUGRSUZ_G00609 [Eucalyptus grandis]|uniref:Uncharacterized protein n=2 Tax=Eucalyptus grandis TaxID=71139 RepID=A0A059BAW6_EUCGR|nr:hypothetical protein EUGRSUZ_G00609 [Eucalyptus grandis]
MAVSLATVPFVHVVGADSPGVGKNAHAVFIILFIITIATGVSAVVSSKGSVLGTLPAVYNAMGMGIFLLSPIVVPLAVCLKHVLAHIEMKVHDMVTEQKHGEPSPRQVGSSGRIIPKLATKKRRWLLWFPQARKRQLMVLERRLEPKRW